MRLRMMKSFDHVLEEDMRSVEVGLGRWVGGYKIAVWYLSSLCINSTLLVFSVLPPHLAVEESFSVSPRPV